MKTELTYIEGTLVGKTYKPGLSFAYKLAIPKVENDEFAIHVDHDGQHNANVNAMLRLADEGKAPYCVSIGVFPGVLEMPNGEQRGMRMNSYDLFDREYGDFLVHELIPHLAETYAIPFSSSPDLHLVSGGSSGGISAFVIAWFCEDYFHRVYMSSPSFLAMGRGNEILSLIRKCETKPLRIYEEYSENEPNDYFGWSRPIDEETEAALLYAGYDFKCAYFPGEGHCSRYHNEEEAYRRLEWIWQGWKDEPIRAPRNSPRVQVILPDESQWERCEIFPSIEAPTPPNALAEAFDHVVLSNDGQAWYAANTKDDVVLMFVKDAPYPAERGLLHATLHTVPRIYEKGAIDMAVDRADRLFVLTAIGIQCVRSFGLVDVILSLPDRARPLQIAVTDALYVKTEGGIYKRALCEVCTREDETKRRFVSYYD